MSLLVEYFLKTEKVEVFKLKPSCPLVNIGIIVKTFVFPRKCQHEKTTLDCFQGGCDSFIRSRAHRHRSKAHKSLHSHSHETIIKALKGITTNFRAMGMVWHGNSILMLLYTFVLLFRFFTLTL